MKSSGQLTKYSLALKKKKKKKSCSSETAFLLLGNQETATSIQTKRVQNQKDWFCVK